MSCGRMRASTTSFSCDRHDVEQRIARPDRFADGRDAQRHHPAIDRRAHELPFGLVLRRSHALVQLTDLRGRFAGLVGRELLILVARLRDARMQLAHALLRRRQVALRFGKTTAIVGLVALQLQESRTLHVTLAYELLVDLELVGRELRGGRGRFDLLRQRRCLRTRIARLRCRGRRSARRAYGGAPGIARFHARRRRLLRASRQDRPAARTSQRARPQRKLARCVCVPRAADREAWLSSASLRTSPTYDQRLSRADHVAVAHENLANDAAFLVLNGLAIQLYLELAGSDDCAGERRGDHPRGEQRCRNGQRDQGQPLLTAQLRVRLRVVFAADQERGERWICGAHACASLLLPGGNATTRCDAPLGERNRASTAALGPNISSVPPFNKASLSSAAMSVVL